MLERDRDIAAMQVREGPLALRHSTNCSGPPPMTLSPEERAEGICAALARAEAGFDKRGWVEMPKADRDRYVQRAMLAKPLIATAIREAENALIDKISSRITNRILDFDDTDPVDLITDTVVALELRQIKNDIRSLKHPKD